MTGDRPRPSGSGGAEPGTLADQPPRRAPLPGVLRVPAHLLAGLSPGRRAAVLAGAGVLLAAVAALLVVAVPDFRARQRADAQAADRRAAAERAAVIAESTRRAAPRRAAGAPVPRTGARAVPGRRRLLATLEAKVLADARSRVRSGELSRPVRSARCFEFPKRLGVPPPAEQTRRKVMIMECIAVNARVAPGERSTGSLIGQPFRARVDFPRGRLTWCRIVQRPGELSVQQALVRVPAACGG